MRVREELVDVVKLFTSRPSQLAGTRQRNDELSINRDDFEDHYNYIGTSLF